MKENHIKHDLSYKEGSKFKKLNFPDPFGYGKDFCPVFPLRHHSLKAILDNIPDTVESVYIYGSSLRMDTAFNSDLDIFIIGSISKNDLKKIYQAIPKKEKVDILIETKEEFEYNLHNHWNDLYRKVFEGGYKVYCVY